MSPFGFFALGLNLSAKDYHTVELFLPKKNMNICILSRLPPVYVACVYACSLVVPACHSISMMTGNLS